MRVGVMTRCTGVARLSGILARLGRSTRLTRVLTRGARLARIGLTRILAGGARLTRIGCRGARSTMWLTGDAVTGLRVLAWSPVARLGLLTRFTRLTRLLARVAAWLRRIAALLRGITTCKGESEFRKQGYDLLSATDDRIIKHRKRV